MSRASLFLSLVQRARCDIRPLAGRRAMAKSSSASKPSSPSSTSSVPSSSSSTSSPSSPPPPYAFEPPYLKLLNPPLPVHEGQINIQLRGYDFVVLEQQMRKIDKLIRLLNIPVSDSWATPLQAAEVSTYKPRSVSVDKTYKLNVYERNVQIELVPGANAVLLIDLIRRNLAAGISVAIHKHLPEHEEIRYIPDLELESLQKQLNDITNAELNPHVKKAF